MASGCGRLAQLLLLASCWVACASAIAPGSEAFIGWQGESYQPGATTGQPSHNGTAAAGGSKKKWIEVVSWKPRAFIYHNFLTDAEAEHIKLLAAPMMKRSTVVAENGTSVLDDYRTSYGTFIKRKADPVIQGIEARMAAWSHLPEVHAEDTQVLRYGLGQQYKPHMDSLRDEVAGPRVCTILLYLNDVAAGGETAFPYSNHWAHRSLPQRMGPFSPCAQGSVAFRPRKGDAFMFWSIHPGGSREDSYSMHTGCPVLQGVKWTATKWIHAKPFRPDSWGNTEPFEPADPGLCQDADPLCPKWAAAGECERNRKYMLGDMSTPGRCPLSCAVCRRCRPRDAACYNDNRRKAGFLVYSKDDLDADAPDAGNIA